MSQVWFRPLYWIAALLVACGTPQPPEGRLSCKRGSDCPDSWFCRPNAKDELRCYRDESDGTGADAGPRKDAGMDGGRDPGEPDRDAMTMDMDGATRDGAELGGDGGDAMTDAAEPPPDGGPPQDAAGDAAPSCEGVVSALCTLDPPRATAPVSTGYVTSSRPLFRFVLASGSDGARVELCLDRACTQGATHFDVQGTSGRPSAALPARVHYFRLYSLAGGALASPPGPVWQFTLGPGVDTGVASSYGTMLDVNGDGLGDLGVGAPDAVLLGTSMSDYRPGPGSAYVYLGHKDAKASWDTAQPAPQITLRDPDAAAGDRFGSQVVSAGDLDGDGFGDLAIGAPCAPYAAGSCGSGRVHVHRGSAAGLAQHSTLISPAGLGSNFGIAIAAGDVDGDGYGDLAVGADAPGTVYVYRGSSDFFSLDPHSPAWTITQADRFGASIANAGDVNGDGFADLLVGAPGAGGGFGAAYRIYGGAANGFSAGHSPTSVKFTASSGSASNAAFGTSVAGALDVNGDGYSDGLVGAPGADTGGGVPDGMAYLYLGSANGFDTVTPILLATSATYGSEGFGATVGGAGDVDGDGHAEIVVGATSFTPTPTASAVGRVLFMSGPTPVTATALIFSEGNKASQFGSVLKAATDLNGDGFADIVIGTPRHIDSVPPYNSAAAGRGKLSIWFGSAASVVAASDLTIDGPDGIGGRFGN